MLRPRARHFKSKANYEWHLEFAEENFKNGIFYLHCSKEAPKNRCDLLELAEMYFQYCLSAPAYQMHETVKLLLLDVYINVIWRSKEFETTQREYFGKMQKMLLQFPVDKIDIEMLAEEVCALEGSETITEKMYQKAAEIKRARECYFYHAHYQYALAGFDVEKDFCLELLAECLGNFQNEHKLLLLEAKITGTTEEVNTSLQECEDNVGAVEKAISRVSALQANVELNSSEEEVEEFNAASTGEKVDDSVSPGSGVSRSGLFSPRSNSPSPTSQHSAEGMMGPRW